MTTKNYIIDWTNYWKQGFLTSCVNGDKDGYPKAIEQFWVDKVVPLFTDNTQLLDLCSGGGGIPTLLLNSINNNDLVLKMVASDYSEFIGKPFNINKKSLTFISNCNCEQLPFQSNSFEFVTSSYGIEYSDMTKTLNQVDSVLKETGYFAAIFHVENSEIVNNSKLQLLQGEYLLNEQKYFDKFRKVFSSRRSGKAFKKNAAKKFKITLDTIKLKINISKNSKVLIDVLNASHDIFLYGERNSANKVIKQINSMEASLLQNYNRMHNLLSIVDDSNVINRTLEFFKENNYSILYSETIYNKNDRMLGYGLIVRK